MDDRREDWVVHRQAEAQVMAAVIYVAEGHAPSVTISNIHEGPAIVGGLREMASGIGVTLELLERSDGLGHDVRVQAAPGRGTS